MQDIVFERKINMFGKIRLKCKEKDKYGYIPVYLLVRARFTSVSGTSPLCIYHDESVSGPRDGDTDDFPRHTCLDFFGMVACVSSTA